MCLSSRSLVGHGTALKPSRYTRYLLDSVTVQACKVFKIGCFMDDLSSFKFEKENSERSVHVGFSSVSVGMQSIL